ncbi:hypothetical protein MKX01_025212 [Papaver californicum]|nr:hypothetical protein MKX01_025212 [Papaver californicum]
MIFGLLTNLVCKGDTVRASTVRKVIRNDELRSDTARKKLVLEVEVDDVEYEKEGSVLRIRGKNVSKNEHVKIGSFHTLEIDLHGKLVLTKVLWDSVALDLLKKASDPAASADLAVVLMQEGLANMLLVGKSVTTTLSRIETSIPRKHGAAIAGYEMALNKFFENVIEAFLREINFTVVHCAVIASPGFTKDQFHKYLLLEAERRQLRTIIENKSRILLVHTTSGYTHSLREVLDAPHVQSLKDFFNMLSTDADRACYGPKHVEVAHERMAIKTLLITDELFRNSDVQIRQKYVELVNSVKNSAGNVHVFSSISGEQLTQMTGIAAILRFPPPDLEDIEM